MSVFKTFILAINVFVLERPNLLNSNFDSPLLCYFSSTCMSPIHFVFITHLISLLFTVSSCCILQWRISSVWQQVCCVNWLRTRKLLRQLKLKEPLHPSLSCCIPVMRALVSVHAHVQTAHISDCQSTLTLLVYVHRT